MPKRETRHAPIGQLFPGPPRDKTPFALSADQVRFFEENGYVRGGRVLDPPQIEALRTGLEAIRTGENPRTAELYEVDEDYRLAPEKNVFHFLGGWLIDEAFHDVLFHPAITVKAAQLLGVEHVRFWHDQVFYKPPRHPGVVTWHQDYSYWTRSTPAGPRDLLDRPRRLDPRQRLRPLRAGQPPLGAPAPDLPHEGHGRGEGAS